jgi:hypothetical protein
LPFLVDSLEHFEGGAIAFGYVLWVDVVGVAVGSASLGFQHAAASFAALDIVFLALDCG